MNRVRFQFTFEADSTAEVKELIEKTQAFAKSIGQNPRNACVDVLPAEQPATPIFARNEQPSS